MSEKEHDHIFIHVAVKAPGKPLELISVQRTQTEVWLDCKFPKGERNYRANFSHDISCTWKEGTDPTEPVDPAVERFMKQFMNWDKDRPGPRGTVVFTSSFGNSISETVFDWLCDNLK